MLAEEIEYGVLVSRLLSDTSTMATLKESIYLGLAYNFRGLVHYQQGRKPSDILAVMVLEKELRVLHLELQAGGRERESGLLDLA